MTAGILTILVGHCPRAEQARRGLHMTCPSAALLGKRPAHPVHFSDQILDLCSILPTFALSDRLSTLLANAAS